MIPCYCDIYLLCLEEALVSVVNEVHFRIVESGIVVLIQGSVGFSHVSIPKALKSVVKNWTPKCYLEILFYEHTFEMFSFIEDSEVHTF